MKWILISIHMSAVALTLIVFSSAERRCSCSRNASSGEKLAWIKLYEDINYRGFCRIIRIEPKECFALADVNWANRAVSVKPDDEHCFRLFYDNRCRGASLGKDAYSRHNDDLGRNFMRAQARSINYYDGNCTDV